MKKKVPDTFFFCIAAFIVGTVYWLGNLYWIGFVSIGGWIAFCFYTAALWPILAVSIRWCVKKHIPLIVAVPILIVGVEQSQGLLLGGFYWNQLAHSQYANTAMIQIADIFGAAGVSFLVGMVNGVIAEVFIVRRSVSVVCRSLLVPVLLIGAVGYGRWRIGQADKFVTQGPLIAAVQTNVPQSVKQSFAAEEEMLEGLLEQSRQAVGAGAELVVWPETMVQALLEPRILGLLDEEHLYKVFDKAIREHAKQGAFVLVGAYGGSPRFAESGDIEMAEKFNAAFLYMPDGNQSPQKYYKIHLVPFGEYIPFSNIPLVHKLFLKFSPYDFDYTIDPGREFTAFEMQTADSNETYRFGTIICYEDAVGGLVRRFALDNEGNKRIGWLVNISNDGWFVRFKNKHVLASTELAQHTVICSFRAIENRLAVLRSVNTGISCMIDTLGRIRDGYKAGNLPEEAFERQGVAGWFADEVPIDARITFFSRYGRWLDLTCQVCLGGIIIAMLIERFIVRKNK